MLLARCGNAAARATLDRYTPAIRRITEQAYWVPLWTFPLTYAFNAQLEFRPSADETRTPGAMAVRSTWPATMSNRSRLSW